EWSDEVVSLLDRGHGLFGRRRVGCRWRGPRNYLHFVRCHPVLPHQVIFYPLRANHDSLRDSTRTWKQCLSPRDAGRTEELRKMKVLQVMRVVNARYCAQDELLPREMDDLAAKLFVETIRDRYFGP